MKSTLGRAGFVEPMKAKLVERPQPGDWIYEIKLDGFRALAIKDGSDVELMSRNRKELGGKFPEVARAIGKIKARDAIIDGEIVAGDEAGGGFFLLFWGFYFCGGGGRRCFFFFCFFWGGW